MASATNVKQPVRTRLDPLWDLSSRLFSGPRRRTVALVLACLPLVLFLLLPLVALVLRVTPASLLSHLVSVPVAQAIQLSAGTTLISTLLTVLGGTPVAWLLARRTFRGHALLDTLLDLPLVLPPAVAGIGLLVTFGRLGLLGHVLSLLGIQIAFSTTAVVLAQTFVAAPFYVRTAHNAFARVERQVEQAAELDGASPAGVFVYVTLPLTGSALLSGAVMSWARALGEFGATIIFAGNFPGRTETMPLAIYLGFQTDLNIAITLSVVLLVLAFVVLFVVKGALRQHLDATAQGPFVN